MVDNFEFGFFRLGKLPLLNNSVLKRLQNDSAWSLYTMARAMQRAIMGDYVSEAGGRVLVALFRMHDISLAGNQRGAAPRLDIEVVE